MRQLAAGCQPAQLCSGGSVWSKKRLPGLPSNKPNTGLETAKEIQREICLRGRADSTKMAELVRGNKETTWSVIDREESTSSPTTTVTAKRNTSSERESGAGSHMTYSQKMSSQGVYFLLSCTTLSSRLFSCYIRPHLPVFLKQGRHSDEKRKT